MFSSVTLLSRRVIAASLFSFVQRPGQKHSLDAAGPALYRPAVVGSAWYPRERKAVETVAQAKGLEERCMPGAQQEHDFDVAIIGYGPTGATLAGLLGRAGIRVGVFDKATSVFAQPRAVGFDHDAMRLFQRIGIADGLAPHIALFSHAEYIGVDGTVIQRSRHVDPPYPLSWAPNYTCDQPGVESVLRGAVGAMPTVSVTLGAELVSAGERGDGAVFAVRDAQGTVREYRASFLVGCDGASSAVRRQMGVALDSMDYDESWIVVDVKVGSEAIGRLPPTNVQYCEPQRPCTFVICPGNHRRWEIMLVDGEPREGALSEERLWQLLARWLKPGEAQIWRAAAYRFHALIAREWRRGRLLLAGDSAHQTPPFLGQGMCQGIRDAGNLAWKLEAVLRGRAPDRLLDTYAQERHPHVAETTRIAKALGEVVSERDPERARARDARLLAKGGGKAPLLIRQELIPGLTAGLIAPDAPRAGEVFPQPFVRDGGGDTRLMDELTGPCFRVVIDQTCDVPELHAAAALHGFPVIVLQSGDAATGQRGRAGGIRVREADTLLRDWFAACGAHGALVRPDHYVFGAFVGAAAGIALIERAAHRLSGSAPMERDHDDKAATAETGAAMQQSVS